MTDMQKAVTTPSRQPRCRHCADHLALHLLNLEVERAEGFESSNVWTTTFPFGCHSDRRVADEVLNFRQLVIWNSETSI